jgi:hypothetical protein
MGHAGADSDELLQEAIDTCPVNCIHWVRSPPHPCQVSHMDMCIPVGMNGALCMKGMDEGFIGVNVHLHESMCSIHCVELQSCRYPVQRQSSAFSGDSTTADSAGEHHAQNGARALLDPDDGRRQWR